MLVDFMIAVLLAVAGVLGLSALATDTLDLNQETLEYTLARHTAQDLADRWRLEGELPPVAPLQQGCASASGWLSAWCDGTDNAVGQHLKHWRVSGEVRAGAWQWCIDWGEGDCAAGRQPLVRVIAP